MNAETTETHLAEIHRAIATLVAPGTLVELRIPNPGGKTLAGWFDNPDKLAEAVASLSGKKPAIYYTLNPVNPEVCPPEDRNKVTPASKTTKDSEIERRSWLLVDFDPKRPAKTSATDAEKEAAFSTAIAVRQYLTSIGFPAPVSGDSGNGGHLLYRIDLPNTVEVTKVIQKFLKRLASEFNNDSVEIDQSVFNAARITKAYGSLACKGEATEERPHRHSRLRIVPDTLIPVTLDQLKEVAGLNSAKKSSGVIITAPKPKSVTSIEITEDKVEAFFDFYELERSEPTETDEGLRWNVICPWNEKHTDGRNEAAVFLKEGMLGFKCFHSHCTEQHWKEYREFYEAKTGGKFWFKDNTPTEIVPADAPAKGSFIKKRASDVKPIAIDWLWEGRIVSGKLNLFAGHPGKGKGLTTMDIAARISRGTDFPDAANPNPPSKVLIFSSEDASEDTLVPRLTVAGADLDNVIIVEMVADNDGTERVFSVDKDLPQLQQELMSDNYGLVIIDPVMNHIGDVDAYKDQEIRRVLTPLQKLAEKQNVGIILVAHLNKKTDADLISRVGGGMGLVGVCRTAWMFTESKDDEGTYLMSSLKTNLGPSNENMSYEIEGVPLSVFNRKTGKMETQSIGHIVWGNKSKEILTTEHIGFKTKEKAKAEKCREWLLHYMTKLKAGKQVNAKEIKELGASLGYSESTTKRAYEKLGGLKPVQAKAKAGGWLWQIPVPPDAQPEPETEAEPETVETVEVA